MLSPKHAYDDRLREDSDPEDAAVPPRPPTPPSPAGPLASLHAAPPFRRDRSSSLAPGWHNPQQQRGGSAAGQQMMGSQDLAGLEPRLVPSVRDSPAMQPQLHHNPSISASRFGGRRRSLGSQGR